MKQTHFIEIRISLHRDLEVALDRLAREANQSLESYVETLLRDKAGFKGPKAPKYLDQTRGTGEDD
jgi:hypothetical protein